MIKKFRIFRTWMMISIFGGICQGYLYAFLPRVFEEAGEFNLTEWLMYLSIYGVSHMIGSVLLLTSRNYFN